MSRFTSPRSEQRLLAWMKPGKLMKCMFYCDYV